MAEKGGRTNFENLLRIVRESPESVFEKHARMLSDLTADRAAKLHSVLAELALEKRQTFYRKMGECSREYYEFNFAPIAIAGMEDSDGNIRASSIEVLGFEDSREIGGKILNAAVNDPHEAAQIAAVRILGQYMVGSVMEERIPVSGQKLHQALSGLIENKNHAVRRAAVEAYAVSETNRVKELVSGFFAGNDRDELICALRAARVSMCPDWNDSVLEFINDEDEEIRIEAIKTAGVLQIRESLPALFGILSEFDRITPDLLVAAAEAVAEIGDESGIDVLETLGEAAVDLDDEITEAIDECIDTLNMTVQFGPGYGDPAAGSKQNRKAKALLDDGIEKAKDRCLTILEEKIPHDLEDDEPIEDEDDECDCGEEHHHHHHHHHHHDNPLEGMDLSRFRILDDLEAYESAADRDEDEDQLWADFEDMAEEDLDADSLQDFIRKLEKSQAKKASGETKKSGKKSRK